MSEIIDFEKWRRGKKLTGAEVHPVNPDDEERWRLWESLPEAVRGELRDIGVSFYNKGGKTQGEEYENHKRHVAGWPDDQVRNFLIDPTTRATLASKPPLFVIALLQRASGEIRRITPGGA